MANSVPTIGQILAIVNCHGCGKIIGRYLEGSILLKCHRTGCHTTDRYDSRVGELEVKPIKSKR